MNTLAGAQSAFQEFGETGYRLGDFWIGITGLRPDAFIWPAD